MGFIMMRKVDRAQKKEIKWTCKEKERIGVAYLNICGGRNSKNNKVYYLKKSRYNIIK